MHVQQKKCAQPYRMVGCGMCPGRTQSCQTMGWVCMCVSAQLTGAEHCAIHVSLNPSTWTVNCFSYCQRTGCLFLYAFLVHNTPCFAVCVNDGGCVCRCGQWRGATGCPIDMWLNTSPHAVNCFSCCPKRCWLLLSTFPVHEPHSMVVSVCELSS